MRYRVTDYIINGQTIVLPDEVTIEDIRLIVNETQKEVICSSMQKNNVHVEGAFIDVPLDVCIMRSDDKLTIEIDKGDSLAELAKQGEDPEATNTAIFNAVQSKLTPLEAVLTELNNGKQEMVDALATKNVQSSTNKTLSAIAGDVRSIAQSPINISGASVYEKQLFWEVTDMTNVYQQPNAPIWNLYKVMADLLKDGRILTHGGIVLAEYDKNNDTNLISGAGAGGAYITSDGNYYTKDTTHTWNDKEDGKINRWVAYCFANEYQPFNIIESEFCPKSIFIGRKIGKISCLANGCIREIVIPYNGELLYFDSVGFSQDFGSCTKFIFSGNLTSVLLNSVNGKNIKDLYLETTGEISNDVLYGQNPTIGGTNLRNVFVKAKKITNCFLNSNKQILVTIDAEEITTTQIYTHPNIYYLQSGSEVRIVNVEKGSLTFRFCTLSRIYVGYKINDKTHSFTIAGGTDSVYTELTDIVLKQGWCKPFTCSIATSLTEENMINHILKRLKQDDEMCGSGVTITLGATNLEKLTSEEAVVLLDSLTNIYGYTFA